jgi:type II secretory ATPase GspE/PulE/Tfp pilus assembly ATPase PilB-like protein
MPDIHEEDDLQAKLKKLHHEGEERAAQRLAERLSLTYVDLAKIPVSLDAVRLLPEQEAKDAKVATIELKSQKVALAAVNPELPATKKVIDELTARKYDVKTVVISPTSMQTAWQFYKFIKPETENITGKINITAERLSDLRSRLITIDAVHDEIAKLNFANVSPITMVEIILAGAMGLRTSDIHTEAEQNKAKIRFRVDGLLHDIYDDVPLHAYQSFVSRIKLLSEMKLNVRTEAQDGRFTIGLAGKEIEMRVSIIPAEFGETIVMRILDPSATMVTLPELGLRADNLALVKRELDRPNGLILNTGPTGSGKTTTLYAFLRTMNDPTVKIITLEDPIEYRIEGVEQTQVNDESGYTFASGLRAIVRQDPDVILVGEVRDLETADISMQAALTGHLVLSTLHTNDAVGAVPRLINLGVKPESIGPALALVIAQRLVRVLCTECKKEVAVDDATKKLIEEFFKKLPEKVDRAPFKDYKIYAPVGCDKCNKMGYKGRVGVFEFLEGGADLETTILKEASEVALRGVAERQGMVTMQQDGILKVLEGKTTFDEVKSATGEISW